METVFFAPIKNHSYLNTKSIMGIVGGNNKQNDNKIQKIKNKNTKNVKIEKSWEDDLIFPIDL
jgi:hypothetical protein